jgi:hypothetical protein
MRNVLILQDECAFRNTLIQCMDADPTPREAKVGCKEKKPASEAGKEHAVDAGARDRTVTSHCNAAESEVAQSSSPTSQEVLIETQTKKPKI